MASAVPAVYQSGFGRGENFIQKAFHCQSGHTPGILPGKMLRQDPVDGFLKRFHAVDTPGSAAPSGSAADNAVPAPAAHRFSVQLLSARIQYIHIKEPAKPGLVLYGSAYLLQRYRIHIHSQQSFAAGYGFPTGGVKHLFLWQAMQQGIPPGVKATADQRRILYRAGYIHGKANNGAPELCKQLCLGLNPGFPGGEHLDQSDFLHKILLSSGSHPGSTQWLPGRGRTQDPKNTDMCSLAPGDG